MQHYPTEKAKPLYIAVLFLPHQSPCLCTRRGRPIATNAFFSTRSTSSASCAPFTSSLHHTNDSRLVYTAHNRVLLGTNRSRSAASVTSSLLSLTSASAATVDAPGFTPAADARAATAASVPPSSLYDASCTTLSTSSSSSDAATTLPGARSTECGRTI